MAQRHTVHLVDDLDGESEANESVRFGLDDVQYEIDLTTKNADSLRDALAPYLGHARKVTNGVAKRPASGGSSGRSRSAPAGNDRQRVQEIRSWAREQGLTVNDRGRIPGKIIEAYDAAH